MTYSPALAALAGDERAPRLSDAWRVLHAVLAQLDGPVPRADVATVVAAVVGLSRSSVEQVARAAAREGLIYAGTAVVERAGRRRRMVVIGPPGMRPDDDPDAPRRHLAVVRDPEDRED